MTRDDSIRLSDCISQNFEALKLVCRKKKTLTTSPLRLHALSLFSLTEYFQYLEQSEIRSIESKVLTYREQTESGRLLCSLYELTTLLITNRQAAREGGSYIKLQAPVMYDSV